MNQLGTPDARSFLQLVQDCVGAQFTITGNQRILEADEDELFGGRDDDLSRAIDIQTALANPEVAAIVAVRGGAWLTRILRHIDFSVLERRVTPIAVFGFSELTSLVNVVGTYPMGRAVHDMGPAFLPYGMKRNFMAICHSKSDAEANVDSKVSDRLSEEFATFWTDVVSILEGRGTKRNLRLTLRHGDVADHAKITVVGGNLVVLSALMGTPFQRAIQPTNGRWLLLEEINEKPERVDRFLANLTLGGFWDECGGLLLGDFHKGDQTLTDAVESLLLYHIPDTRNMPILKCCQLGHVWPMSPILLHTPLSASRTDDSSWKLDWPNDTLLSM